MVKDFCQTKKIPFSVKEFIDNPYQKRQIETGAYPLYFFTFSKEYVSKFGNDDIKRMIVARNKKLLSKVREVLGDDFI
jgi:hypothetical protein